MIPILALILVDLLINKVYTVGMARITIKDGKLRGLSPKKACFVIEYIKDFAARRAAEASGHAPDKGNELLKDPQVQEAIQSVLEYRLEEAGIDGAWILYELIDNHRIARQQGNISASNTALKILAQLAMIDAMANKRLDHLSSDGSMTPAPHTTADVVKQIAMDLEEEV